MIVILFGPPGAGKGTQAELISRKYSIPHIATGDIFREAISKGTELGRKAEEYLKRGDLVPDDIVNGIVWERISRPDCRRGFILDGYPRTMGQAKALDEMLDRLGMSIDVVLNINVDEENIIRRLSYRRICRSCGAVYHLINNPPKREGVCDKCGGQLYQRVDDREDVIRNRLKVYYERTRPLIEYYRGRGLLVDVDGNGGIEEVWRSIESILDRFGGR